MPAFIGLTPLVKGGRIQMLGYLAAAWSIADAVISNRYPTKKENPTLCSENGVSYTVISHPFV